MSHHLTLEINKQLHSTSVNVTLISIIKHLSLAGNFSQTYETFKIRLPNNQIQTSFFIYIFPLGNVID